jgi:hypothetical protein
MLQKLLWSTAAWLVPLVDALCVDLRGILVIFLAALVCTPNPTIIYFIETEGASPIEGKADLILHPTMLGMSL